jgi:hypothetical protein
MSKHPVRKYKFSAEELNEFSLNEELAPKWYTYRGVVFSSAQQFDRLNGENYAAFEVERSNVKGVSRFQTFLLRGDLLRAVDIAIVRADPSKITSTI